MLTKVLAVGPEAIEAGAALLRAGELVAFPTETVYGLGGDGLNKRAIARIYEAKGRPADNPLILHIAEMEDLEPLVRGVDRRARRLIERFWPGPLTLILARSDRVPALASAGLATVAVRMPAHPAALALIRAAGCPVAAPSANRSGRPSPTLASHVFEDLNGCVPLILDGGPTELGVESTVLDVSGERPVLLRPGGVTREMLLHLLPDLVMHEAVLQPLSPDTAPASPGMKYRHYAPSARLVLVTGSSERLAQAMAVLYDQAAGEGRRVALLVARETAEALEGRGCHVLGSRSDLPGMTASLFETLRTLDAQGVELAYAETVDPTGLGLALMNRLGRAAAFQAVDVSEILS